MVLENLNCILFTGGKYFALKNKVTSLMVWIIKLTWTFSYILFRDTISVFYLDRGGAGTNSCLRGEVRQKSHIPNNVQA